MPFGDLFCCSDSHASWEQPWLLEVNNSPSLSIESTEPVPPAVAASFAASTAVPTVAAAGGSGEMHRHVSAPVICTCKESHDPHIHGFSAVDAAIKGVALGGAFAKVLLNWKRDRMSEEMEVTCESSVSVA